MTFADATPYEPQRRRLHWMVKVESALRGVPVAQASAAVARAARLTPDQLVAIRNGKRKDLYATARDRIDDAFLAIAERQVRALRAELGLALADRRGGAAGGDRGRRRAHLAASLAALEALIAEADAGLEADPARDAAEDDAEPLGAAADGRRPC